MITVKELEKRARSRLDDVLRELILGENPFPLQIRIALPEAGSRPSELSAVCTAIRSQSGEILPNGYSVEWRRVASKRGENDVPVRIYFASSKDFFGYTGENETARVVLENARNIEVSFPGAKAWAAHNLALLKKSTAVWKSAIAVAAYLRDHPFPCVFARQLPVAMSTKFVEHERALLCAFVGAVAPEALSEDGDSFEERAGLLTKDSLISVNILDGSIDPGMPVRRFAASVAELGKIGALAERCRNVLIVENDVTFLTLPEIIGTIAVMGQGFAVERLGKLSWLADKRIYYWGDIDADGFRILARLRRHCAEAKSLMMDEATFGKYACYQGFGSGGRELETDAIMLLTDAERSLFEKVLAANLRLEQEKIPPTDSHEVLRNAMARAP